MKRPVILGGGVAGISAGVELAEAGVAPLLIESRPFLGGRVRSFVHDETGDEIDNGQHLLMGCYRSTIRLLRSIGTERFLEFQPSLCVDFRHADGTAGSLSAPSFLPSPFDVLFGMLRFKGLSIGDRFGLLRVGLDLKGSGPRSDETVEEYLIRLRQSDAARRRLWDPIVLATLNTHPRYAAASLFGQVMRLGFLGTGNDSRLAFPSAGLSRLFDPAEKFIAERGGMVLKGSTVTELERDGADTIVRLRDGRTFRTSHLISALPWRSAVRLLGPLLPKKLPFLRIPPHNPILSIYLWFDRELTAFPKFCATEGMVAEWVFNRRRIVPATNDRYPGLLCCVISAAERPAYREIDVLIERTLAELRSGFPELKGAQLLTSQAIVEKRATFSAIPETEPCRPPTDINLPGILLAGDWTATDLPGTIEGAALSGERAAKAILR